MRIAESGPSISGSSRGSGVGGLGQVRSILEFWRGGGHHIRLLPHGEVTLGIIIL